MKYAIDKDLTAWRIVDGEAVVIQLETSYYYHLNQTGTYLWKLLAQSPQSEAELVLALAANVERQPEVVAPDVTALLESLTAERLVARHEQ